MSLRLAAIVVAVAIVDRLIAEPPVRFHPVVWFGRLVGTVDRPWRYPKLVGGLAAIGFPLGAAAVVWLVVTAGGAIHPVVGTIGAGFVLFASTSHRLLCATAREVIALSTTDLPRARRELRALAGRDASELSAELVRSAAVESAAENLSDGLLAPLVAVGLTSLAVSQLEWSLAVVPLAAAAAVWVKAVNTMDSMVGYRSKPVGWGAARLDDLVMWVPARLTACSIATAAASPDPLLCGRRWARTPASPNAGWPMATLSAALHVRLEKPETYTLNPMASLPTVREARRGVDIVDRAGWLAFAATAVVAGV